MAIRISTREHRDFIPNEEWRDSGAALRIHALSGADQEKIENWAELASKGKMPVGTFNRKAFDLVCVGWSGVHDEETDEPVEFNPDLVSPEIRRDVVREVMGANAREDTEKNSD